MSSVDEKRIREIVKDEIDQSGHRISRRGVLGALGLAGGAAALSSGASAEQFSTTGQGQVGTHERPLAQINADEGNFESTSTEQLSGGVTGGVTLSNIAGTNLSIDSNGSLNSSGGGTETYDAVISPSDDVQAKIDNAGTDAKIFFQPGIYTTSTAYYPYDRQTWDLGQGVEFQPSSDNRVLDFSGVYNGSFGRINVSDPNSNTTSKELVYLGPGCVRNEFDYIYTYNAYNAVLVEGASGAGNGTAENRIGHIECRDTRNHSLALRGETHDNYFVTFFADAEDQTGGAGNGIDWSTSGVDGGNMFSQVWVVGHSNHGLNITSGEFEAWFGQCIFDSCGGNGVNIELSSSAHRLFFDTLWTSTNQKGFRLKPGTGNTFTGLQISSLYAHNNDHEGVILDSDNLNSLQVGKMIVGGNDASASGYTNLNVNASITDSHINVLRSFGGQGIDTTGSVTTSSLGYVFVDGTFSNSAKWSHITYQA